MLWSFGRALAADACGRMPTMIRTLLLALALLATPPVLSGCPSDDDDSADPDDDDSVDPDDDDSAQPDDDDSSDDDDGVDDDDSSPQDDDDASDCAPDPYEPNDDVASAAPQPPVEPVYPWLCPSDVDVYFVELDSNEFWSITILYDTPGSIHAEITDDDGAVLESFSEHEPGMIWINFDHPDGCEPPLDDDDVDDDDTNSDDDDAGEERGGPFTVYLRLQQAQEPGARRDYELWMSTGICDG